MLDGRIFKQITGRDVNEFSTTTEIFEATQTEYAEKMRKIIRGENYDNPIIFFGKDGSGGGFREKLGINDSGILSFDEIFEKHINSL